MDYKQIADTLRRNINASGGEFATVDVATLLTAAAHFDALAGVRSEVADDVDRIAEDAEHRATSLERSISPLSIYSVRDKMLADVASIQNDARQLHRADAVIRAGEVERQKSLACVFDEIGHALAKIEVEGAEDTAELSRAPLRAVAKIRARVFSSPPPAEERPSGGEACPHG